MDLQTRDGAPTDVEAVPDGEPDVPVAGVERGAPAPAPRLSAALAGPRPAARAQLAPAALIVGGLLAGVPYPVSLPVVLAAGAALGAYAVSRRGWPKVPVRQLSWPIFLAVVVTAVALVPVVAEQHFAAPVGNGSDAHVAAGAGNFLKH